MPETGTDALTRSLTGREFLLVPRTRVRFWLPVLLLLIAGAGYAAYATGTGVLPGGQAQVGDDGNAREVIRLKSENQVLARELDEIKMAQAHDKAALAALQKDYAEQVEALRQANRNLAFYRKNVPGAPASNP